MDCASYLFIVIILHWFKSLISTSVYTVTIEEYSFMNSKYVHVIDLACAEGWIYESFVWLVHV